MPYPKSISRSELATRLSAAAVVQLARVPATGAAPAVGQFETGGCHEGAAGSMAVTIPTATLVIVLAIVTAIAFVVWMVARERRFHAHAYDVEKVEDAEHVDGPDGHDDSDPPPMDAGESMHRLGTFQPRDAKRLLALLVENNVPFELDEVSSPGMEMTSYVPLRTTNLVVLVPESSFAEANAILNQAGFAPEMEDHPGDR